jgi:hypothetical protein
MVNGGIADAKTSPALTVVICGCRPAAPAPRPRPRPRPRGRPRAKRAGENEGWAMGCTGRRRVSSVLRDSVSSVLRDSVVAVFCCFCRCPPRGVRPIASCASGRQSIITDAMSFRSSLEARSNWANLPIKSGVTVAARRKSPPWSAIFLSCASGRKTCLRREIGRLLGAPVSQFSTCLKPLPSRPAVLGELDLVCEGNECGSSWGMVASRATRICRRDGVHPSSARESWDGKKEVRGKHF